MVYLYLGFSIAPLYLARIFLYTHAQECARTHKHTQPYVHDPLGSLRGVFSSLIRHYLYDLLAFFFFFFFRHI